MLFKEFCVLNFPMSYIFYIYTLLMYSIAEDLDLNL